MKKFKAMWVQENSDGSFAASLIERDTDSLPAGELLIEVRYSSLNYKDALSARGNKGVTRSYPHTPGIDAAGVVLESQSELFKPGAEVIVIGYDLGMNTSGGFGQLIRVPAAWAVPKPAGLSLHDSMIIGTAGFTAALCVEKLLQMGLGSDTGEVLVTGASGGVGMVAVALLSQLGFQVVASTGKQAAVPLLTALGAKSVLPRDELAADNPRPLGKERWAGAVDVVGGTTLANILKSLKYNASAACCGLVGSTQLPTTVLPFILRNVNLLGVDSVNLPLATKERMWTRLAREWRLVSLEQMATSIGFDELAGRLDLIFRGESIGRVVLDLKS